MAALSGNTIASTFSELLRMGNSTLHATTGYYIKDAADTNSALSIAQTRVGIGTASPEAALHIKTTGGTAWDSTGASGNSISQFSLLLRNANDTANSFSGIAFDASTESDADSIGAGIIAICRDTDSTVHHTDLAFATNLTGDGGLTERMRITGAGKVGIGCADPQSLLEIHMGTSDDEAFTISNSDVVHGMDSLVQPDTWFGIEMQDAGAGGAVLSGYKDSGGDAITAIALRGCLGKAVDTTKGTGGYGTIQLQAAVTDGVDGITACGNDGNLVSIDNHGATRFIFDAEGELHSDAIIGVGDDWDEWSDLQMASDLSRLPKAKFNEMMKYSAKDFEKAGLLTLSVDEEGNQHAFIRHKAMLMFSMCCFGETYNRISELEKQNKYLVNELYKNNILKEQN